MRQLWLAIYLPSFLIAVGQQAVVIMLPLYAAQLASVQTGVKLGATAPGAAAATVTAAATLAALFMAVRGAGSLLVNVPAGLFVERFGDKRVMLVALALLVAGALLLSATPSLNASVVVICFAAGLFGAGSGAWLLARLAYVSEAAPLAYRGRALAGLGGVQRLGLLVGPVVGGTLVHNFGYSVAFMAAAGCMLLAIVLIVPFTRDARAALASRQALPSQSPPSQSIGTERMPGLASVLAIVRAHREVFLTAGVAITALAVLRASRQMLIPLWGTLLGLDAQQVGVTFMLSSAIEIGMAYPAGYVVDHKGHKWAAVPCFALLCISIALLPFASSWPALIAVAVIAGIGNGMGSGIMMTFGSDYAPPAQRGEFLGVWRMMGDAGQVLGPLFIGAVAAGASLGLATFGAAAIGVAGMALMAVRVREPIRA